MRSSDKFLIIGATGLIGKSVAEELNSYYQWQGTNFPAAIEGCLQLDITNKKQLKEIFAETNPKYVIHCANLAGGVDYCERNPAEARKFHYEATISIGQECYRRGAKLAYISTECVFDGKKELYYELDSVSPLNIYGKWKAKSEEWIRSNLKRYTIARTMSVYGWDPLTATPNALMKVYFSILNREKLFIPTLRWGNPTYVKDLAKAIVELCLSEENGIFHIAGATFINRYDWLRRTCDALGWDSSLLLPSVDSGKNTAYRPYKIRLMTDKFRMSFKTKLHSLREALELLRQDIVSYNQDGKHRNCRMKFKKLSILMPVYNEKHLVCEILERVMKCQLKYGLEKEIIIVDDCSTDGTAQIIENFLNKKDNPVSIKFIKNSKNMGKGASIRNALKEATGDIVVFQDADLEYDPEDYNALIESIIAQGAEVVYGSRFLPGRYRNNFSFKYMLANKFLTLLSNISAGLRLTDMETCYKMFKADVIKSITIQSNGFAIEPEITTKLAKEGFKIHEVPVKYSARLYREGKKIGWRDGLEAIGAILKY